MIGYFATFFAGAVVGALALAAFAIIRDKDEFNDD